MPSTKITQGDVYSIVTDSIGKPIAAYNGVGNLVWEVEYDIYGNIRSQTKGEQHFIPFRNQGQHLVIIEETLLSLLELILI
ncbi:RHS domain-containing protein [Rapidithrix thailandica]|uniref:RHS domain-containing protein n=1 Tax=Rapidithrix thailandica TaxID=413964 RepID=A0AAW9S4S0_9BACT